MAAEPTAHPGPAAEVPHGAVLVGAAPGIAPRVYAEARRYAQLLSAPLAVIHVDVTRFVTVEDPDGTVHSRAVEAATASSRNALATVEAEAGAVLADADLAWSVHQLVGDPALAILHLADAVDAPLLVVGTRRRGFGESLREFFTGSVAARLAHRQRRPILVVPSSEPLADDEEPGWDA